MLVEPRIGLNAVIGVLLPPSVDKTSLFTVFHISFVRKDWVVTEFLIQNWDWRIEKSEGNRTKSCETVWQTVTTIKGKKECLGNILVSLQRTGISRKLRSISINISLLYLQHPIFITPSGSPFLDLSIPFITLEIIYVFFEHFFVRSAFGQKWQPDVFYLLCLINYSGALFQTLDTCTCTNSLDISQLSKKQRHTCQYKHHSEHKYRIMQHFVHICSEISNDVAFELLKCTISSFSRHSAPV